VGVRAQDESPIDLGFGVANLVCAFHCTSNSIPLP
jgi:hypothetical protein